jgi:hypothetical protein
VFVVAPCPLGVAEPLAPVEPAGLTNGAVTALLVDAAGAEALYVPGHTKIPKRTISAKTTNATTQPVVDIAASSL